jgi:hypothetical protein
LSHPSGNRLYELSDEECARLDHVLALHDPRARGGWVRRFLSERVPGVIYPPGERGQPTDVAIDRAIGGNLFTPKWGTSQRGESGDRLDRPGSSG